MNINIELGTIVKTTFFLILLYVLYQLIDLVLVVLTAVVIASAIEPATKKLGKYKIPRVLAVLLLYIIFFGMFIGIFYFFLPPLLSDLQGLTSQLPEYSSSLNPLEGQEVLPAGITERIPVEVPLQETLGRLQELVAGIQQNFFEVFTTVFGGVLSFVLIVVISFYLAVQERGIENFLAIITPIKYESYVINLWQRAQTKIGLWLRGQLLLAVLIGILVYLGLALIGVKYALLLAVTAAVFELIPFFGPILAAVPGILMAYVDGGTNTAIIVFFLYVIIQQFENHLIYPLVVRQVIGVPAIIAIIALIAGGTLAGILGVILSVPLAAVLMELLNDLDREKHRERGQASAA